MMVTVMKVAKFAAAGVLSASLMASGAVHAGGMAEPLMEPEVIAEETAGTSGFVVPLILLAVIAAVLLIDNGGGGGEMINGPGDLDL